MSQTDAADALADLRASCTDPTRQAAHRRHEGCGLVKGSSYNGFLTTRSFQRYLEDDRSTLLWIKGDAGKGKTMLLCGIIDEIEAAICSVLSPGSTVSPSYFFCEATDTRLRRSTAALKDVMYLLSEPPSRPHSRAGGQVQAPRQTTIRRIRDQRLFGVVDLVENLLSYPELLPPSCLSTRWTNAKKADWNS